MEVEKLKSILDKLKANDNASPFLTPVLWKEWNLLDYPEIVKLPMDLQTVESKLQTYKSTEEFLKDVNSIWDNCRIYNPPESEYSKMADKMERATFEAYEETLGKDPKRAATLEERDEFVKLLYSLSEKNVGRVIEIVSRLCPSALLKISDDELSVDVDLVDSLTLEYLRDNAQAVA